jgi:hypothetical protein
LLAATLYQRSPEMNHKLWNIVSTERYILHMQVLLEATSGAGTTYPSGVHPWFLCGVCVIQALVLCVCFVDCCSSFFLLDIVLSVLGYTDSDYPFGIFNSTTNVMTSLVNIPASPAYRVNISQLQ